MPLFEGMRLFFEKILSAAIWRNHELQVYTHKTSLTDYTKNMDEHTWIEFHIKKS